MHVLIGEREGDYGDHYQRPREPVAVSGDRELLEQYQKDLGDPKDHGYVEFVIEEALDLDECRATRDLLMLVEVEVPLTDITEKWTPEERAAAEDWAVAAHLDASDNEVELPARPEFLSKYKKEE